MPDSTFYTNALNWAWANGIVKGYDGTNDFAPEASITRQELAILVWRASDEPTAENDAAYLATADAGSEWNAATAALKWTAENNVLSGSVENNGTYLHPYDLAQRAQAAKIFVQASVFLSQRG